MCGRYRGVVRTVRILDFNTEKIDLRLDCDVTARNTLQSLKFQPKSAF